MVDFLGILNDFIIYCAERSGNPLAQANVYRSWVTLVSLPKGSNEFAVMTTMTINRRGSNVYDYDYAGEIMSMRALRVADVQVDFWSKDERCFDRAEALEGLALSEEGSAFFRDHPLAKGFSVAVVDCPGGIRDMSAVGDADQFVRRASMTIQIEFWSTVKLSELGTPGPLQFKHFENVDASHPPIRR
jgi:hypothetical protein